jgi:hypothetical protein
LKPPSRPKRRYTRSSKEGAIIASKQAYYLAFPDEPFEIVLKTEDGEIEEIWTAGVCRPAVFMRMLEKDGYEVRGMTSELGRVAEDEFKETYRRWNPIDLNSLSSLETASRELAGI